MSVRRTELCKHFQTLSREKEERHIHSHSSRHPQDPSGLLVPQYVCMYRLTTLPHLYGHFQLQELLGNQDNFIFTDPDTDFFSFKDQSIHSELL